MDSASNDVKKKQNYQKELLKFTELQKIQQQKITDLETYRDKIIKQKEDISTKQRRLGANTGTYFQSKKDEIKSNLQKIIKLNIKLDKLRKDNYDPNTKNMENQKFMKDINNIFDKVYQGKFIKGVYNNVRQLNNVEKTTLRDVFNPIKQKYDLFYTNMEQFKVAVAQLEKSKTDLMKYYKKVKIILPKLYNFRLYVKEDYDILEQSFTKAELSKIFEIIGKINSANEILYSLYSQSLEINSANIQLKYDEIKKDLETVKKMIEPNGKIKQNTYQPFIFISNIEFLLKYLHLCINLRLKSEYNITRNTLNTNNNNLNNKTKLEIVMFHIFFILQKRKRNNQNNSKKNTNHIVNL
jgi:hypothetical protein